MFAQKGFRLQPHLTNGATLQNKHRKRERQWESRQTDVKSKQIKSENTKDTIRERVPCGRVATGHDSSCALLICTTYPFQCTERNAQQIGMEYREGIKCVSSLSLLRSLNPYCPSLSVCSVTLREIDRKSNLSEGINCSLTFCISFPLFRSLYPSFSIFSFIFFSVFSFSFCGFLAACFACKFLT